MIPLAPFTTAVPLVVPGNSRLVVRLNMDGCHNGSLVSVDGKPGFSMFPGQSLVVEKSPYPAQIITKQICRTKELEFGYKPVPFSGCGHK